MLRLAAEREQLKVIDDQIGAPTGAELLADVTAHMPRAPLRNPALAGTYHLGGRRRDQLATTPATSSRPLAPRVSPSRSRRTRSCPSRPAATPPRQAPAELAAGASKLQQRFGLRLPTGSKASPACSLKSFEQTPR